MASRLNLRPRLLPTVAAALGIALTLALGSWQLDRAGQKLELQRRMERAEHGSPLHLGAEPIQTPDMAYYKLEASGEFLAQDTVYLDNRTRKGVAGYEVITPLRLNDGGRCVLVNRGWVAAGPSRSHLPEVRTPAGHIRVEGVALPGNQRGFELSNRVQVGRVWEHVTVERYRNAYGLELQPIIIRAQNDLGDGLARDWPPPDVGVDRHRAYAAQWFAMALAIFVLYVVLTVKRKHSAAPAA